MLGLRMGDVLQPLDEAASGRSEEARIKGQVKEKIVEMADALCTSHEDMCPADCGRAPVHLQMVALALASQRVLHEEAQRGYETGEYALCNALKVRTTVANALGVVAPPDGASPQEVGGMWLPNKLSLFFTGATFLPQRRQTVVERMMQNFEADLGSGFEVERIAPSPSREMTRCFYADFLQREAETAHETGAAAKAATDARVLVPVFQAGNADYMLIPSSRC